MFNQFHDLCEFWTLTLDFDGNLDQAVTAGKIAPGWVKYHETKPLPTRKDFLEIGVQINEFRHKGLVVRLVFGPIYRINFLQGVQNRAGLHHHQRR